ncbi:probable tRNA N6-adenosine threonylcarbamoyltransferase, mitochondrial isoform X3 [Vespa velutina]|uniref:probable tRNA N6-adenosine threonylcarbamoyltransferase, mitochondrial isoform X3 n=1 Tax=Vespa velutina TaxID=202808 RepID=UPI001FB1BBD2|nr:probable tRNA N6-adenosine threonylcarbamoyltransferase, mitochondrial isoform X3 [Vespa velutina]
MFVKNIICIVHICINECLFDLVNCYFGTFIIYLNALHYDFLFIFYFFFISEKMLFPLKHLYPRYSILKSLKKSKKFSSHKPAVILGIESSCDDTGCGIVDSNGNILGEAINSQCLLHSKYGGIIPTIAKNMHRQHITEVCEKALRSANLRLRDVDAIATTVKPGLSLSLQIGERFGKYLAVLGNKPFIPIHHMQAHALTVRITEKVDFPYLVLLISGGHSMLVVVQNVQKFIILGSSMNNAPGEILDKAARRLKLNNIKDFNNMSGGEAVEAAACKASNVNQFIFNDSLKSYQDCRFSFSGILATCIKHITEEEKKHNIIADMIIPDVYNLCASLQFAITKHLCHKTQRAIEFLDYINLIPEDKRTLVISGGVACNNFIAKALDIICSELNYKLVRTPPRLCTDNGVMIAWNGVEKWISGIDILRNESEIKNVTVETKAAIGEDWTERVRFSKLKCKRIKIEKKLAMDSTIANDAVTISSNSIT